MFTRHHPRPRPGVPRRRVALLALAAALCASALAAAAPPSDTTEATAEDAPALRVAFTTAFDSLRAQAEEPDPPDEPEPPEPPEAELPEPVIPLFEVEGRLAFQQFDPDPATSGMQGALLVNGFNFSVPVGVPVRVGEEPGEAMSFADIAGPPTTLVGRSTIIATGHGVYVNGVDVSEGIRWIADDVFLEEAENVLHGIFTSNDGTLLHLNGVPIVMETDPRFAPFNKVQDSAGQPLDLSEVPVGVMGTVEGVYRAPGFYARVVEVEAIVPSAPGEPDFLSVDRAEYRDSRGELRLRGVINNVSATLSVYEWLGDRRGALLAADIAADIDGAWGLRVDSVAFASAPPTVEVVSSGGGRALAQPVVR